MSARETAEKIVAEAHAACEIPMLTRERKALAERIEAALVGLREKIALEIEATAQRCGERQHNSMLYAARIARGEGEM